MSFFQVLTPSVKLKNAGSNGYGKMKTRHYLTKNNHVDNDFSFKILYTLIDIRYNVVKYLTGL